VSTHNPILTPLSGDESDELDRRAGRYPEDSPEFDAFMEASARYADRSPMPCEGRTH
jgi:hypothetical protein